MLIFKIALIRLLLCPSAISATTILSRVFEPLAEVTRLAHRPIGAGLCFQKVGTHGS
jgi:hypothetical protein